MEGGRRGEREEARWRQRKGWMDGGREGGGEGVRERGERKRGKRRWERERERPAGVCGRFQQLDRVNWVKSDVTVARTIVSRLLRPLAVRPSGRTGCRIRWNLQLRGRRVAVSHSAVCSSLAPALISSYAASTSSFDDGNCVAASAISVAAVSGTATALRHCTNDESRSHSIAS